MGGRGGRGVVLYCGREVWLPNARRVFPRSHLSPQSVFFCMGLVVLALALSLLPCLSLSLSCSSNPTSVRAVPLARVRVKLTVKNAVCKESSATAYGESDCVTMTRALKLLSCGCSFSERKRTRPGDDDAAVEGGDVAARSETGGVFDGAPCSAESSDDSASEETDERQRAA